MKNVPKPRYELLVKGWFWDHAFTLEEAIEKQKQNPKAIIYDTAAKEVVKEASHER